MTPHRLRVLVAVPALVLGLAGCPSPSSGPGPAAPGAPALSSAVPSDAHVTVTWSPSSGATSYNLHYAQGSTVTTSTGTKVAGVTSPYAVPSLTNGGQYAFLVTAVNAGGESAASGVLATRVGLAPRILFTSYANDSVTIGNWVQSGSAVSYNLYYAQGSTVTTSTVTPVTLFTPGTTVPSLSPGAQYAFIMTAVYPAGEGPAGSVLTVTPSGNPAIGFHGNTVFKAVVGTPVPPPMSSSLPIVNAGQGTLSGLQASVAYTSSASAWLTMTGSTLNSQSLASGASYTLPLQFDTSKLADGDNTAAITIGSSVSGVASLGFSVTITKSTASTQVGPFLVSPPVANGGTCDIGALPTGASASLVFFSFTNNSGSTVSTGSFAAPVGFFAAGGSNLGSATVSSGSTAYLGIGPMPTTTAGPYGPTSLSVTWTGGPGSPFNFSITGAWQ
jgi:hypothetical protein